MVKESRVKEDRIRHARRILLALQEIMAILYKSGSVFVRRRVSAASNEKFMAQYGLVGELI